MGLDPGGQEQEWIDKTGLGSGVWGTEQTLGACPHATAGSEACSNTHLENAALESWL